MIREKAGYTQKTLASKIGYSEVMVNYIENARRKPTPKFRNAVLSAVKERLPWLEMKDIFLDSVVDNENIVGKKVNTGA